LGRLTADVGKSAAQQIVTVLLVSTEPIGAGQIVSNINVDCNQGDPLSALPNTVYEKSAS
jgi:transcriptional regulator